jgi:hypothetical protein
MDMTVIQIGVVVVAELRSAGYMESTIAQYAKTIRALSEFAGERVYSVGLGAEFASMTVSPRTGRFSPQRRFDYRRLVGVFDSYGCTGRVDLSVRGRGGGGPQPRVSEFAALDVAWEAEMSCRGLAPATRAAYGRVARSYLVFREERGIVELGGADGASVLAFLESLLGRWARSSLFLGGVELSPVPEVHGPCRFGRCGESGRRQTLPGDNPFCCTIPIVCPQCHRYLSGATRRCRPRDAPFALTALLETCHSWVGVICARAGEASGDAPREPRPARSSSTTRR